MVRLALATVAALALMVDAQPLPTSKEQCKQRGYRQFGFKNQGQCVAFVTRGPQP